MGFPGIHPVWARLPLPQSYLRETTFPVSACNRGAFSLLMMTALGPTVHAGEQRLWELWGLLHSPQQARVHPNHCPVPCCPAQPSSERCFSSAGTLSAPLPCLTLLKPRALLPFTGKSLFPRKGLYNERQTGLFWESVRLVRHQEFSLCPLSAFGGVACCSAEQRGQVEVRALLVLSFPFIYTAPACSGSPHVEAFPSAFLLTSGFRVLFVQSKLRVSPYLGAKLGEKSPQKHEKCSTLPEVN